MIEKSTADMIGQWLSNQIQSHDSDMTDELRGSEDGTLKVSASIQFKQIGQSAKFAVKCKFSIPRQSITTEDSFDLQMNLPGM